MEQAFDALKETAEGEILEAAKAQVAQRSEKLLSAVDVGKFLQGAPQFSSCLMPAHTQKGRCLLLHPSGGLAWQSKASLKSQVDCGFRASWLLRRCTPGGMREARAEAA